jgi:hypothetical protein
MRKTIYSYSMILKGFNHAHTRTGTETETHTHTYIRAGQSDIRLE